MKAIAALALITLLVAVAHAADKDSHWEKAYPPADKGQVRYVLHLPPEKDEHALKVEIIAGQNMETDGVNHYLLGGKIEEKEVEGWGYPKYIVTTGPTATTLIGVPPGQPKVTKFVTLGGEPYLIRYNSKLPVVVYAPEGVEVRYRIWKAEPEAKAVDKG